MLVVVNLDPVGMQHGFVQVDAARLGVQAPFLAQDLLTGERYTWRDGPNYVRLDPVARVPAHILRIEDISA